MRTAEDFDRFYQKPDPWQVQQPSIRDAVLRTVATKYASRKNILELGCGEGCHTEFLSGIGASVLAIDISKTAIERAIARNLPNATFCVADFIELEIGKAVEVIFAIECLYYLSEKEQSTFFMNLKTSGGGKVLIFAAPIIGTNEHRKYYTPGELEQLFRKHEFRVRDRYNLSLHWGRTPIQKLLFLPIRMLRKLGIITSTTIQFLPSWFIYQRCYVVNI